MSMPKKRPGQRVQIYLPADLLERWKATPRYQRSATVAAALRQFWGIGSTEHKQVVPYREKGREVTGE